MKTTKKRVTKSEQGSETPAKGLGAVVVEMSRIESQRAGSDAVVRVLMRGLEVLGPAQLPGWMTTRIPALGGQTPYSVIETEEGRKTIETELGRIEHGIF